MPAPNARPGQSVSARATNLAVDQGNRIAVEPEHGLTRARLPKINLHHVVFVRGHNGGDVDINAYELVEITGSAFDQNTRGPVISLASPPSDGIDSGHLGVAMDGIVAGRVGRVAIAGLAWALTDGSVGLFANPVSGDSIVTLADDAGMFPVIASIPNDDATAGVAMIRIGSGGGGGGSVIETVALPEHSHGGKGDGGWAGFLSGGL